MTSITYILPTMLNFGYCVWLHPDKWKGFADGFEPHLSLATNLTLEEAIKIYNNLPDFKDTRIHLGEGVLENTMDFWAFYYRIDNCESLDWMPHNPHVSFLYNYDKPVENLQIQMVRGMLGSNRHPNRSAKLTHASVVLCNGHYSSWKKISSTNKKDVIKESDKKKSQIG